MKRRNVTMSLTILFCIVIINTLGYFAIQENTLQINKMYNVEMKNVQTVEAKEKVVSEDSLEKLMIKNRKIVGTLTGEEYLIKGIAIADLWNCNFDENRSSLETFRLLKEDGFNTIRYQLSADMFYNFSNDTWNEKNLYKLTELCDRAKKAGLYIIIDMHALMSSDLSFYKKNTYCLVSEEVSQYEDLFVQIWCKIAQKLNGHDNVLAYELINEPFAMYKTNQQAALERYSYILQKIINDIRKYDDATIISIQPIHSYINEAYEFTTPKVTAFPNVKDSNILLDCYHSYDRCIYGDSNNVLNKIVATGAQKAEKDIWYKGESILYSSDNQYGWNKLSLTISGGNEKGELVDRFYLSIKNANGANICIDDFRIYKIKEDETEEIVLNLNSKSSLEEQQVWDCRELFGVEKVIPSDAYNLFIDNLPSIMQIGIEPKDKIRIEVSVHLTKNQNTENAIISWVCRTFEIMPNQNGKCFVSGYERLLQKIQELDAIAFQYNSPIYFGEFCVMDKYINEYTSYKEYIDSFVEIANIYDINWIWHRMTEYPHDNGYGAYVNSAVPYKNSKRESMWNYIIPQMLRK